MPAVEWPRSLYQPRRRARHSPVRPILPADVTPHLVVWTFGLRRDGETAQVKYVPRVRPRGAAIFRGQVWTVLGSEFQLLLDDARSAPIRVFPPESWAAQKVGLEEWAVMEGDTWVDRLGIGLGQFGT